MNIKKIVQWTVVVFVAWYLIIHPAAAGEFAHNLLNLLGQAGTSVANFLRSW